MTHNEAIQTVSHNVAIYNGSVSMDVLITNTDEKSSVMAPVYDDLKIDDFLTFAIHPNLHKKTRILVYSR